MSLLHGCALEEVSGTEHPYAIDIRGLDEATLQYLHEAQHMHGFNRVELLQHIIRTLITKAFGDQVLKVPPPILTRVYQTLSRGFVNLLNAKKIAGTPFPFPFAQLITMLLLTNLLMTPVIMAVLVSSKVFAFIFTFVPIFGLFSLNFVAMELENPFGNDDNDLPLMHFQEDFNNCLIMLLHTNTDSIAGLSDKCLRDFDTLKKTMW